jgi:HD-like signal output (HDOD) protein/ActR/RegA family two-component response regulator
MKSILFVDDDEKVLNGLRRLLMPFDGTWHTEFACGAEQALRILSQEGRDVIVADLRMPGINGVELLAQVSKLYPQMVRIILSGTLEEDLRSQATLVAHQYLSKPCDPEVLKSILNRAFALRDVLVEPALRALISGTVSLPSTPTLYTELMEAVRSSEASVQQLGAIIARDPAMTAKVLQLVNSAFFGISRSIGNPADAVAFLGVDAIAALAISISAFSLFQPRGASRFSIEHLQGHSLAVAGVAREIAKSQRKRAKSLVDDTFTAGILHDLGKLMLFCHHPKKYEGALDLAEKRKVCLRTAERELLGTTHAEIGGYLLWLWGLPDSVAEAVAFHHNPSACPADHFDALTAVHVAEVLVRSTHAGTSALEAGLDMDYLTRIGAIHELPEWEALAGDVLSRQSVS